MAADGYFMCGKSDRYLYCISCCVQRHRIWKRISYHLQSKRPSHLACVVTWFNPQAIIDGTMMPWRFPCNIQQPDRRHHLSHGVACASFSWFISLTFLISLISSKFNAKVMRWINIVCGVIIIGYGIKFICVLCADAALI